MRMWDLALYMTVCINLAIAIISSTDVNVLGDLQPQDRYFTEYQDEYIFGEDDFSSFNTSGTSTVTDYASQASFGASLVEFLWSLVTGFVSIYKILVEDFRIPAFWAGAYQTIVYIIYALGFFSLVTGRHPDQTL
jgi:hypothetical protein